MRNYLKGGGLVVHFWYHLLCGTRGGVTGEKMFEVRKGRDTQVFWEPYNNLFEGAQLFVILECNSRALKQVHIGEVTQTCPRSSSESYTARALYKCTSGEFLDLNTQQPPT